MNKNIFNKEEAEILENIILRRRDVRGNRFTKTLISDEILDKIIYAGINAPSVGFSQPWEFVIIKDELVKHQVLASFNEENDRAMEEFVTEKQAKYKQLKLEGILEAPVNIAVFYKPSDSPVLGQNSMKDAGIFSVVCAIQNMWLMARVLNIGLGWVSIIDPEKVKGILNAPKDNKLVAYLCLGYVEEFLDKPEFETIQWEKRKHMNEVIFHEKYKTGTDDVI